jgi:septation ring formation regulator EzrA
LEFKIRSVESSVSVLKDQIRYLRLQNKDAEDAQEEAKKLRKELETLKRYLFVCVTYMPHYNL